jgi:hypothetical protein
MAVMDLNTFVCRTKEQVMFCSAYYMRNKGNLLSIVDETRSQQWRSLFQWTEILALL